MNQPTVAKVSSSRMFHQPNTEEQEPEPEPEPYLQTLDWSNDPIHHETDHIYAFDFDPLSPPNVPFFTSSASHSHNFTYTDPQSDSDSDSPSDSDRFLGEDDDQMNFVTDLFASRDEEEYVADDQDSVADPFLDLDFRVFDGADSGRNGLRVAGIDSDSDSEELGACGVDEDGTGLFGDSDDPFFWDCLGIEEHRARTDELDWEEVDERENLSLVIDGIEELSVSTEISSNGEASDAGDEAVRSLEWEILLAANNLERSHEFVALGDDYVYEAEYDTLFGQFVQNESALKGSPPAAKSVVENLPSVVLTKEDLLENNVVCAVCKDEISVEEEVTRLPCCHHYHGDCIVPWLSIRNTCPVCRYELPTDDLDYEERKTQMDGLSLPRDLQILELIYGVGESQ